MDRFGCNGFEVTLGGDCELETMIRALKIYHEGAGGRIGGGVRLMFTLYKR